ncbi:MAG TPA: hypothetical protein VGH33_27115 [Isosphaeraceae bacterium]|jgi:hypothetical protein
MKITVVTGPDGKVIGTMRHPSDLPKGQPRMGLIAGPGQRLHELDLPAALEKITSGDELHHALAEHLRAHSPGGRA